MSAIDSFSFLSYSLRFFNSMFFDVLYVQGLSLILYHYTGFRSEGVMQAGCMSLFDLTLIFLDSTFAHVSCALLFDPPMRFPLLHILLTSIIGTFMFYYFFGF